MKENQCVSCLGRLAEGALLCELCYDSWFDSCTSKEHPLTYCAARSEELLAILNMQLANPNWHDDKLLNLLESVNVLQCIEYQLAGKVGVEPEVKGFLQSILVALYVKSSFSGQLFHRFVMYESVSVLIAQKSEEFCKKVHEWKAELWTDIQKSDKRHESGILFQKKLKRLKMELLVLLSTIMVVFVLGFVLYTVESALGYYLLLSGGLLTVIVILLWLVRYSGFGLNLALKPATRYLLEQILVPENYLASLHQTYERLERIERHSHC